MTDDTDTDLRRALLERARELLLAKASLAGFLRLMRPDYQTPPHIEQLCEALDRVVAGTCRRLLIVAPPRHGKTESSVRMLVPYYLGRHPSRRAIVATYGQDLASDHGRDVRRLITSEAYRSLFDVRLAFDSSAREAFDLEDQDGGARFVGRGGAVTGRGAHLLILDDLIKNAEEADSEQVRASVWDYYVSTLRTRLEPGGSIVAIGTRWHFDDYLGRLQASDSEPFEVLHFPAIDSQGEALWPERFPANELQALKQTMGTREFSALYLGAPLPDTGDYFKREWLRYYEHKHLPEGLGIFTTADLAYTGNADSDFSVICTFGVDRHRNVFILDLWRERAILSHTCAALVERFRTYKPQVLILESDPGTSSTLSVLREALVRANCYRHIHKVSAAGSKPAKARATQALFELGRIHLPRGRSWVDDLETELLTFPAGKHDDQVDALSLIGRVANQLFDTSAEPEVEQREYMRPDGTAFSAPVVDLNAGYRRHAARRI